VVSRIDSSSTIAISSFFRIPTLQRRFQRPMPGMAGLERHPDLVASGRLRFPLPLGSTVHELFTGSAHPYGTSFTIFHHVEGRMSRRSSSHAPKVFVLDRWIGCSASHERPAS